MPGIFARRYFAKLIKGRGDFAKKNLKRRQDFGTKNVASLVPVDNFASFGMHLRRKRFAPKLELFHDFEPPIRSRWTRLTKQRLERSRISRSRDKIQDWLREFGFVK